MRISPKQQTRSTLGFTLIEFAVVIAIIAVLGMAADQAARLNVVYLPAVQMPASANVPAVQAPSCAVNLHIFDTNGNPLASKTVLIDPNESMSLTYPTPGTDPTAVELHASISIPMCPDNTASCPVAQQRTQRTCLSLADSFSGSLEIVDNASGKTVVALPAVQRRIFAAD